MLEVVREIVDVLERMRAIGGTQAAGLRVKLDESAAPAKGKPAKAEADADVPSGA